MKRQENWFLRASVFRRALYACSARRAEMGRAHAIELRERDRELQVMAVALVELREENLRLQALLGERSVSA